MGRSEDLNRGYQAALEDVRVLLEGEMTREEVMEYVAAVLEKRPWITDVPEAP